MAVFKCKMCGGTLEINNNETTTTCEYCGTQQTLPKLDDDRKANLYDRANHFRRNNEFDKAMGIYEQILNVDNTDAEAYWSLVLCQYGIEYVEDPVSHKRIPTVNRAQFTSIFDDMNYKSALQHADISQKIIYENEAKAINEIQKGILAISQKEEPFDVFICYKESDNNGRRTQDSVLANDLYHQLAQEGFKVFFARITLEDKLGSAYEPYIFAALNSAKVMVVLGTKPEFFNAVWVKNEWSRYLALIKQGQKKMLIPAYKDMDPYDLPEEFSHLQAQDMSKLGFMQDLIRGIKKIIQVDEPKTTVVQETIVSAGNVNIEPLLKRAFMFLEDVEWKDADEYCEKVLDLDPECAEAYLGKLMAELHVKTKDSLRECKKPFDNKNNYQKVIRFANDDLKNFLLDCIVFINTRNENERLVSTYERAMSKMEKAQSENAYVAVAEIFKSISEYKDSNVLAEKCYEKAEIARKDSIYDKAIECMQEYEISAYEKAIELFDAILEWKDSAEKKAECIDGVETIKIKLDEEHLNKIYDTAIAYAQCREISSYKKAVEMMESILGWKDSEEKIYEYKKRIEELEVQREEERLERERKEQERARQEEQARQKKERRIKRITIAVFVSMVVVIIGILVWTKVVIPSGKYEKAMDLLKKENYKEARVAFEELGAYKDASQKAQELLKQELDNIKIGDYIYFGAYEQDNDRFNGKEPIEWLVLEIKEGEVLLISKYGLDCQEYSNCRTWMNGEFFEESFTEFEKDIISINKIGTNSECRVFFLNRADVNEYFASYDDRICEATIYAKENGVKTLEKNNVCSWWLSETRYYIGDLGEVKTLVAATSEKELQIAIRPAIWIDLDLITQ